MADRFYCPAMPSNDQIILEGDEAKHLSRVRRLGVGDRVEVFDGKGFATAAEVVAVMRDRVELRPEGNPLPDREPPIKLTLATAVPKGDRFDWLIEKLTELGVWRLQPIITERSVVDPRDAKLDRLRRAIVEASKQCGRNRLMELERPIAWRSWLEAAKDPTRLIAHPGGSPARSWPAVSAGESATLAIGPEGGFTDGEFDEAKECGWIPVSLGQTLLRIETAGIAGATLLLSNG